MREIEEEVSSAEISMTMLMSGTTDDFGHLSALTVFRGKDFTLKAHKACKKILNIESNEVCNRCPSRPTVPLTFIYA